VLVQDGNMANRKFLSDEKQLQILFNDDSGDELIPELDFSDSDSDCGNENSETLVHDGAEVSESESVPDTSRNYRPTLSMQTLARNYLQGHEIPTSLSHVISISSSLRYVNTCFNIVSTFHISGSSKKSPR
jgi:hypothetical protein